MKQIKGVGTLIGLTFAHPEDPHRFGGAWSLKRITKHRLTPGMLWDIASTIGEITIFLTPLLPDTRLLRIFVLAPFLWIHSIEP